MRKLIVPALFLILAFTTAPGCSSDTPKDQQNKNPETAPPEKTTVTPDSTKVTFIELGSLSCIPCKMMQPIIEEIKKEYAGQVKVVFYDVRTPEGRPQALAYKIRVIPTQVFLDKDGREYFRHEGFFPKEDLVRVLQEKGVGK